MKIYKSNSVEDTASAAGEFASELKPGDIVALVGGLGAGKTAFVKGIAKYFHAKNDVLSPTYTLVNEYSGDVPIYHFDVYRLNNPTLDECDWIDEYLFGNGITIIEWADNIKNILPERTIRVEIKAYPEKGEDYREIKIC